MVGGAVFVAACFRRFPRHLSRLAVRYRAWLRCRGIRDRSRRYGLLRVALKARVERLPFRPAPGASPSLFRQNAILTYVISSPPLSSHCVGKAPEAAHRNVLCQLCAPRESRPWLGRSHSTPTLHVLKIDETYIDRDENGHRGRWILRWWCDDRARRHRSRAACLTIKRKGRAAPSAPSRRIAATVIVILTAGVFPCCRKSLIFGGP
jgi:hypothetical protein